MRSRRFVGEFLALTLVAAACGGEPGRPFSDGPNIVLVSVDTLRADRLSLYGHQRPTTPFLERLASSAVVFNAFHYNGGGTLPSHMTMLTGLHPATHQISPHTGRILEPERVTPGGGAPKPGIPDRSVRRWRLDGRSVRLHPRV